MELHLAEINVSTLVAPLDDPRIDDFRNALDEVNAIGEASPGFVWRLKTDEGNATSIQAFDDPLTIVNLTVWTSIETLRAFVFDGLHREFLRRRREFFLPTESTTAMWWIAAGTLPTIDDAKVRLEFMARHGDSAFAFGIQRRHPVLAILPASPADADVRDLLDDLDVRAGADGRADHTGEDALLVARLDGRPVGCGSYRTVKSRSAQLSWLGVRPGVDAALVAPALLAELAHRARGNGLTWTDPDDPNDGRARGGESREIDSAEPTVLA